MQQSPSSPKDDDRIRTDYIIETFVKNFGQEMRENPKAWRGRFRKMVSNEFAFYRGSAVLFYRDMKYDLHRDRWLKRCPEAAKIFIHVSLMQHRKSSCHSFDAPCLGRFTRGKLWNIHRSIRRDQF